LENEFPREGVYFGFLFVDEFVHEKLAEVCVPMPLEAEVAEHDVFGVAVDSTQFLLAVQGVDLDESTLLDVLGGSQVEIDP